jgi:hypothetical protein
VPDHLAGHVRVVEAGRDAVRDRVLERVVVEDGAKNEARELRLARGGDFRLLADARPHRIEAANTVGEFRDGLGQGGLPA